MAKDPGFSGMKTSRRVSKIRGGISFSHSQSGIWKDTGRQHINQFSHTKTFGTHPRGGIIKRTKFPTTFHTKIVDSGSRSAVKHMADYHTHYSVGRHEAKIGAGVVGTAAVVGGGAYAYKHREDIKRKAGVFHNKVSHFHSSAVAHSGNSGW